MRRNSFFTLVLSALLTTGVQAHEGHDMPGALPPPPNGGRVATTEHAAAHNEGEKEEPELFIEAKLEGAKLKVFPLSITANNTKQFNTLKPSATLTMLEMKLELARSKKMIPLKPVVLSNGWEADIVPVKERVIVHVIVMDGKEKKTANVQIEKK